MTRALGLVAAVFVAIALMMAMMVGGGGPDGAGDDEPEITGDLTGGLSDAVPAQYRDWVLKAGALCPEVSPALIAAQIEAESNWDPKAVSSAGAEGLSQLIDHTWLRDDDGNGKASPFDPGDAIMTQGRMMCSFAVRLAAIPDTDLQRTRLMLASYNAGPYAVLRSSCKLATVDGECVPTLPNFSETRNYIKRILALIGRYTGVGGPGLTIPGGWTQPVAKYTPSSPFHKEGQHWKMCGWHTGYDYAAPNGTAVVAVHDATVLHAGWGSSPGGTGGAYGNQVVLDHGSGVRTYYAHLSAISVTKGQRVTAGQVVGQVGNTGNSFGAHLHLELTVGTTGAPRCDQFKDPFAFIENQKRAAPAQGVGNAAIAVARSQLGKPYSLGGGDLEGMTVGQDGRVGWDCSSLVRYAWYVASGGKTVIPRTTWSQIDQLKSAPDLRPGDLIFFDRDDGTGWSHVGMYIGGGQMIHAPNPKKTVEIVSVTTGYYSQLPTAFRRP